MKRLDYRTSTRLLAAAEDEVGTRFRAANILACCRQGIAVDEIVEECRQLWPVELHGW